MPTCSDGFEFQTHLYEPLGEPHSDLWAQGVTFGRDRPLRRQLLLPYHPCLTYRSQPQGCSDGPENRRSARRPTCQPRGRISASEDHVWRRYTPHETHKNTRLPRGGGGTRSPRRRRWSRWRRAGADGHVLVAGRQRAGAGRRGPTRPARTHATGTGPRGRHGLTRPARFLKKLKIKMQSEKKISKFLKSGILMTTYNCNKT